MKAPVLFTVLLSLTHLYIFTIEALPQWRPQGRFGKRLDPIFSLLSQLDSHEHEDLEKDNYESKDFQDTIQVKIPTKWCVQLTGGRIRCIGGRKRRSLTVDELSEPVM